ncbi:MAG: phosphotransferase [Actinobacteria bacterium]|nr:phosphotransferase [Actinomycetota bacterium]
MSNELLTSDTVLAYLIEKQIISASDQAEVEVLTGGVSNVVLAITTKNQKMVLKQALAELMVAQKWEADQRRAIVEANAIALFHKLSPDQVPNLVFLDPERFILILDRVPVGSTVWKSDLLDGVINPDIAEVLGATLAQWHNFGEKDKEARLQFMEDSLFEQLRIDPFYRFVAAKNEALKPVISRLIYELEGDKTTIVHGDFSPKNIMVGMDDQVYILDFEVTHVGNPVFDLAFLLAHLLCKKFRTDEPLEEKLLGAAAERFINAYEGIRPIASSLSLHTALIALARVEGKSPVNYLDSNKQNALVSYTKDILGKGEEISIIDLFQRSKK